MHCIALQRLRMMLPLATNMTFMMIMTAPTA
jgi:hypothetical protein